MFYGVYFFIQYERLFCQAFFFVIKKTHSILEWAGTVFFEITIFLNIFFKFCLYNLLKDIFYNKLTVHLLSCYRVLYKTYHLLAR